MCVREMSGLSRSVLFVLTSVARMPSHVHPCYRLLAQRARLTDPNPNTPLPRRDMSSYNLAPFELAQLSNLCPDNAQVSLSTRPEMDAGTLSLFTDRCIDWLIGRLNVQEAKAIIPSLDMPDRESVVTPRTLDPFPVSVHIRPVCTELAR